MDDRQTFHHAIFCCLHIIKNPRHILQKWQFRMILAGKKRVCKLSVLPQYMDLCFHSCWPFVVLHCQAWKCLAVLFFFSFFYLAHSWKLLPPSLKHFCAFEAGEHPHTHTTTDPRSWLVLNPWQGALSLNIKDPHLRACRQDSHTGLSYSQQATWVSNSLDVAGATWGHCHVCGVGRT